MSIRNTSIGLTLMLGLGSGSLAAQHIYPPQAQKWNSDLLGTQRAVVHTQGKGIFRADIPWRNPAVQANQKIRVVDSLSGKEIQPLGYGEISPESGTLYFNAQNKSGTYYLYFLPYRLEASANYPQAVYLQREDQTHYTPTGKESKAQLVRLESVDDFNSPAPMGVLATKKEVDVLRNIYKDSRFVVFPEKREFPVQMSALPQRWVTPGYSRDYFKGKAERDAFYALQLVVWAKDHNLKNVKISVEDLTSLQGVLSKDAFSCINAEGISYSGAPLHFTVDVPSQGLQPLWCGFQISRDINPGDYSGKIKMTADGEEPQEISIDLEILPKIANNQGFDEPWKMTRLPWLNSTLAQENTVIPPYKPIEVDKELAQLSILGREVKLSPLGLPEKITTHFSPEMTAVSSANNEVLSRPISFSIQTQMGKNFIFKPEKLLWNRQEQGLYSWTVTSTAGDQMKMEVQGSLEFDGFMDYTVKITALQDLDLKDISMDIPYTQNAGQYVMGLGEKGGLRKADLRWKWDVAHKNQDGAWLGSVNAGLHFSLRDQHYVRPLNTNFYLQKPLLLPDSWGNENKGGIDITAQKGEVLAKNYSGSRHMKKGEVLYYNFNLLITPFHPIDTEWQWENRFYHKYVSTDVVKESGANVVNIHHGNEINPYINYPFVATQQMKDYVDEAHEAGLKVKIYNTIREVSNRMYELQPVRSLGHEVFSPGKGGGYSWLQEHLYKDYIAAWYVPEFNDAAIINSGMNRWHNYYVEGMNWLVDHIGIDGIYLDDVAFDRVTMKRIKRVLTKNGHPGIIDLHSANQYNERDGFNNSANLYLEHFPYLNRLWFGEYFDYENNGPDFFLTEVSGIPFGLMGEMLQNDGNPWRGMLYGMTNRLGWSDKSDPRPLWAAWDDFGIKGSQMIGYWSPNIPVKTNNDKVLTTVYQKEGKAMVSLASWAPEDTNVQLGIDWEKLNLNPAKSKIYAPAIEGFQSERQFKTDESIPVPKNKGWLLIISQE